MRWQWSWIMVLVCIAMHGQDMSYALYMQPIHPMERSFDEVTSICRDDVGRFWILSGGEIHITTTNMIYPLESYFGEEVNHYKWKSIHIDRHKVALISEGGDHFVLDLLKNTFTVDTKPHLDSNPDNKTTNFEVKTNSGIVYLASNKLFLKKRYGEILPISLRDNKGYVDTTGTYYANGETLYYQIGGLIYYVYWRDIDKMEYLRYDSLPDKTLRISYPLAEDRYLLGVDAPQSLFMVSKGIVTNICQLQKNVAYCRKQKNKVYFHATEYGRDHVVLIDDEGILHLLDKRTLQLSSEVAINQLGIYLKNMITDKHGNVWIGSYNDNLIRYNPTSNQLRVFTSKDAPALYDIFRIYEDHDGWIWIGMSDGMLLYLPAQDRFYSFNYDPAKSPRDYSYISVSAFAEDGQKRMWLGSYAHGLSYFDKGKLAEAIARNADNIWQDVMIHSFNKKNHITNMDVKYLNYCENGILHARLDGSLLIIDSDLHYTTWPMCMGTPDIQNNNYNYTLSSHEVILGVSQGILKVDVDDLIDHQRDPIIIGQYSVVEDVQSTAYAVSAYRKLQLQNDAPFLILRPDHPLILLGDLNLHYSYEDKPDKKLDNNSIIIPTHEPKSMLLSINDANGSLSESRHMAIVVEVLQAWYKRWWARMAAVLLIICALALLLVNYLRTKRLSRMIHEFQNQSLRSQMNPHFISNSLNSINLYVLENKTEEASQYIVKFSKLIRQILNNTREEYVPLSVELQALEMYIQMEKLRFKDKFEYSIDLDQDVSPNYLVPSMLLQPIVENAIWHGLLQSAVNGYLHIWVHNNDNQGITVSIEDDGIGREASKRIHSKDASKNKSFGSSIVQQRLHLLNKIHDKKFAIKYEDLNPKALTQVGTKVTIHL